MKLPNNAMTLPSPRRIPLRALSKNSLDDLAAAEVVKNFQQIEQRERQSSGVAAATKREGSTTPSRGVLKMCARTPSSSAAGHYKRTPTHQHQHPRQHHTPTSAMSRNPNVGKFLSPLPLQPRTFRHTAQKKVKIDIDDYFFRDTNDENEYVVVDNDKDATTSGIFNDKNCGEVSEYDDDLYNIKLSKTFDEGETESFEEDNDDDDSRRGAYTLEDFKFVRKLGCGGTADVYEVLEMASCALYALKVQKATENALCELDLHIPLRHTNICQMVDYFYSDTKPFADMDYDVVSQEKADATSDTDNVTYLCTILEICDGGDFANVLDEYEMVSEKLAAKVRMNLYYE